MDLKGKKPVRTYTRRSVPSTHLTTSPGRRSVRSYARQLGIRFTSVTGRLDLTRKSPIHKLWIQTEKTTNPSDDNQFEIQPFDAVEKIVEAYGPQIWGLDRSALVSPGFYQEYQRELFWETDRVEILQIFRALYNDRKEKAASTVPMKKRKRQSTSAEEETPTSKRHSDAKDSLDGTEETDIFNLFLTTLWITAPQYGVHIQVRLGRLDSPKKVFDAVQSKLNVALEAKSIDPNVTPILTLSIAPPLNLGLRLGEGSPMQRPVTIKADDSTKLSLFRRDLESAWEDHRKDTCMENVICFASVYF